MATYVVTDPQKRFYLHGGGDLGSLEELFSHLQVMDDSVYQHHVNGERNDFANWVKDVMQDCSLARKIAATQEKDALRKLLFIQLFR